MKAPHLPGNLIIFFAATATVASTTLPGYPTALDRKIQETIIVEPGEKDLSWLTPELRRQALARLREALQSSSDHEWGVAGLVALEDPETLADLMTKYHTLPAEGPEREDALRVLVNYGDTSILMPFLAKDLDNDQIYRKGSGDVLGDLEWRFQAATKILDLIYLRNEFPPATKAWAKSLVWNKKKYLQVKQWWVHHKDLITARRYSEAIWLPATAEENKLRDQAERDRFLAGFDFRTAPRGQPAITPPASAPNAAGAGKSPITTILWSALAIIALSVSGLLWCFFRKRASSR